MSRRARALALAVLVLVTLAACGVKNDPEPPDDDKNVYPRVYPPEQ